MDTKYPFPVSGWVLSIQPKDNVWRSDQNHEKSVKDKKREPSIEAGCEDSKFIGIDKYSHKNKEYATYD